MGENDETVPEAELAALAKHHLWAKDETARWNRRAAILRGVERFKLTEEQGEILCLRRGVGPLNPRPNPAKFDIWSVAQWPVIWVLAWIIFRDEEHVRHCWPDYMKGYHVWRNLVAPGKNGKPEKRLLLVHADLATIALLGLEACLYSGARVGLFDAQKDLFDKLSTGQIECTGRPADGGLRRKLPAMEFIDAELDQDSGSLLGPSQGLMSAVLFTELRFASADVRRIWPGTTCNSAEQRQEPAPVMSVGGGDISESHREIRDIAQFLWPEGKALPANSKTRDMNIQEEWKKRHPPAEDKKQEPPPSDATIGRALKGTRFIASQNRRRPKATTPKP